MSDLASLSNLVSLVTDRSIPERSASRLYIGLEHLEPGNGRITRFGSTADIIGMCGRFEPDDILFGKLRPNLRKSAQAQQAGLCSTEILVLRTNPGHDPAFAAQVVRSEHVFLVAERATEGTRMPRTSWRTLASIPVHLPDREEQRAVADILDAVDATIRETEALIAKLKLILSGLLFNLLTECERAWPRCRIGDIGDVKLGLQRSPARERGPDQHPYLRVANVFDGRILLDDVLSMHFDKRERDGYAVKDGDILLNEGQSLELVGRCAIFEGPSDAFCFQNTLIRFRPGDRISVKYAFWLFRYWLYSGAFAVVARRTTSIAHLGADRFAKMLAPIPPPRKQEKIVWALEAFAHELNANGQRREKLEQLRHGLRKDLISRRVRVAVAKEAAE